MTRWAWLTMLTLTVALLVTAWSALIVQQRIDRFCAGTATTLDLSAPDALALCR